MYQNVETQKRKKTGAGKRAVKKLNNSDAEETGIDDKRTVASIQMRRGHRALTYVVTIAHRDANGGEPVLFYRDNVLGHPAQAAVIRAAMARFAVMFPGLEGAPDRAGRAVEGDAPDGAIEV